jgi:hypothetical protein
MNINEIGHISLQNLSFVLNLRNSGEAEQHYSSNKLLKQKPIPEVNVPPELLKSNIKVPHVVKEIKCNQYGCHLDNAELTKNIYEVESFCNYSFSLFYLSLYSYILYIAET